MHHSRFADQLKALLYKYLSSQYITFLSPLSFALFIPGAQSTPTSPQIPATHVNHPTTMELSLHFQGHNRCTGHILADVLCCCDCCTVTFLLLSTKYNQFSLALSFLSNCYHAGVLDSMMLILKPWFCPLQSSWFWAKIWYIHRWPFKCMHI